MLIPAVSSRIEKWDYLARCLVSGSYRHAFVAITAGTRKGKVVERRRATESLGNDVLDIEGCGAIPSRDLTILASVNGPGCNLLANGPSNHSSFRTWPSSSSALSNEMPRSLAI